MPGAIMRESGDTRRGPSPIIWARENWLDLLDDPSRGIAFWDDFASFPKTPPTTEGNWGQYAAFSDTGGTMTNGDTATSLGGSVAIGSDGDNEGASFRTLATPFRIDRNQQQFCFECRIKTSTIADTKHNILIGLMEDAALTAISPITAAGAIADVNLVGFRRTEAASGGAIMNTVYKANGITAVTLQSVAGGFVADTYTKLGMKYYPRGHKSGNNFWLAFFQDGVELATGYQIVTGQGTDFPNDVPMGLFFAVLNATASTPGTSTIDWWRASQQFAR